MVSDGDTMTTWGGDIPVVIGVVLNWRDASRTTNCVDNLLALKALHSIVVVDNESSGELRDLPSDRVVLVEKRDNLGFSRGVNEGIRRALGMGADAVLAINNDADLPEDSYDRLVRAWMSADQRGGVFAPRILNEDGSPQSNGGHFRPLDTSTNDLSSTSSINYLTWACVLVPRSTFEDIGLLDERFFMYWEDVDFGLRARDAGFALQLVSESHATHSKSASHGRAGASIDRYSTRGLVLLCLKRRGSALWVGLPYRLAGRLLSRARHPQHFRAVLAGVVDGVVSFRESSREPS